MSKVTIIGWDIGGAHLKAVLLADGLAQQVLQVPCPLWRGLEQLEKAVAIVLQTFKIEATRAQHAVTMTGELVDLFENRHAGVLEIASLLTRLLGQHTQFYAANKGFVAQETVAAMSEHIASANWHASATYLATKVNDALFVDVGSTTADFVRLKDGVPQINGFSDSERLRTSELVYTGVYRTPVMAVAQRVPFKGAWQHVAAEHFATMADVYRITGDCRADEDMSDTADGKDKSVASSTARLARMVGCDADDATADAWRGLACYLKHAQIDVLKQALFKHLSQHPAARQFHLVGAGAGSFLVEALARQLGFKYVHVTELITANNDKTRDWAAVCLPAYAVALLATKQPAHQYA